MARRISKDLYKYKKHFEGTFVGPVKVRRPEYKGQRFAAECHKCNWVNFTDTAEDAIDFSLWHLHDAHLTRYTAAGS